MARLIIILLALLGTCSAECTNGADPLSDTTNTDNNYLDLRQRMDSLSAKMCTADILMTEVKNKVETLETSVGLKIDNLGSQIENLGLRIGIEIRDLLSEFTTELKVQLGHAHSGGNDTHPHHRPALLLVGRLETLTSTMSSLNWQIIDKLDDEVLPATTRLEDKLYALTQYTQTTDRSQCSCNASDDFLHYMEEAAHSSWITILRRVDGGVNFTRDWNEYTEGFGDIAGEFWIGLEDIHQLTSEQPYRLRVVMTDFGGEIKFAEYASFFIRGSEHNYRLQVTGFVAGSTAGDSLARHNGMEFSTYDNDNDKSDFNCASLYKGGWWYQNCQNTNPTGLYLSPGAASTRGVNWRTAYDDRRSFQGFEMSISHMHT